MKKALIITVFAAAIAMFATSCTPQKQACAAYSKADVPTHLNK
ncbi:MAG: hypothetical protein NWR73_08910 [Flavobacteriales bacterium]|jgi:hypothetical protein|nr:hypothetical protein [Flavobacteriales bacterium]